MTQAASTSSTPAFRDWEDAIDNPPKAYAGDQESLFFPNFRPPLQFSHLRIVQIAEYMEYVLHPWQLARWLRQNIQRIFSQEDEVPQFHILRQQEQILNFQLREYQFPARKVHEHKTNRPLLEN